MTGLEANPDQPVNLGEGASGIVAYHVFEQRDVDAIEAALSARRPLLIRGEPGVGKTQLALAVAKSLGWGFRQMVVDSRTEARDLKWSEDLVARLANAQLVGALKDSDEANQARTRIGLDHYVTPGPLWWAFDWSDAKQQAEHVRASVPPDPPGCDPSKGVVILIDEIDKAESELPNGLLEALGSREFTPAGRSGPIRAQRWPLVVITTNEERRLPDAFIRRCVVHDMRLPDDTEALKTFLIARGRAHFKDAETEILEKAATMTSEDRAACAKQRLWPLPGQAEYLDLLRAVLGGDKNGDAMDRLNRLHPYFLRKHPQLRT